jgi:hypothetical protein
MMRTMMLGLGGLVLLLSACGGSGSTPSAGTAPQTVTLTQTGCQFVETEGRDYQFKTQRSEDCAQINGKTLSDRKSQFKPLKLKAGTYKFQVTNRDVPYELGFYLRGEGISQATLPKVSGGGLTQGKTQSYEITLKPGQYLFSCPLNPTPDYPIIVES